MNDDAARDRPSTDTQMDVDSNEFQNLHEIVRKPRANLDQNAWDYIVGGTETETTLRRNRIALDAIAFRPRVLRDVNQIDPSVEVFGRKLRLPVMLAPVGSSKRSIRAAPNRRAWCERFRRRAYARSVSEPEFENVAKAAPNALRIFQLYVRGDDAFVEDYVERAIANGYTAFCLTVDSAHYSRRERDLAKRHVTAGRRRASGHLFQMALDWRTVKLIKERYKFLLIIKGIATAEDARIALDHGVEWIYVSNHGGRQLDHGRGTMHVLPEVVEAAAGRAKIMIDGSFCRGNRYSKRLLRRVPIWSVSNACNVGRRRRW